MDVNVIYKISMYFSSNFWLCTTSLYPKINPMGRLGSGQDSEMACFVVIDEPKNYNCKFLFDFPILWHSYLTVNLPGEGQSHKCFMWGFCILGKFKVILSCKISLGNEELRSVGCSWKPDLSFLLAPLHHCMKFPVRTLISCWLYRRQQKTTQKTLSMTSHNQKGTARRKINW